jgi:hypothetical protein
VITIILCLSFSVHLVLCLFVLTILIIVTFIIIEHLATRVKDGDVDVRLGAIGRLIELGTESPDNLSKETFLAIGQRLSDKKSEVRKLVLVGLSRLYYRHVSSALPTLSSLSRANKDSQVLQ